MSWSSDFALYLWLCLIDKHHTFGACSVSHWEWAHIFCRSLWPIFHGSVICLVSPTLSFKKASYFGYVFNLTLSITSYYLYTTVTYFSWSSDFAFYLWLYLIDKHHTLGHTFSSYFGFSFIFTLGVISYFVGHCDLYCTVLWFCLVYLTLSNEKAWYFRYLLSLSVTTYYL